MDSVAMTITWLSGRLRTMDRRQIAGNDFEDDGAGRLAIMGVLLVLAVVAAGIALNLSV